MVIKFVIIFVSLIKLYLSQNVDIYLTQNLTSYLLKNYDKNSKPVGQVNVSMQITLTHIVSIQEKDQTITISVMITQTWMDPRLAYNSSQFGDLSYTTLSSDKVWV